MSTWRTRVAVAAVVAALPLGACQRDDAPTARDPTPEPSPATASSALPGSGDPWTPSRSRPGVRPLDPHADRCPPLVRR